MQFYSLLSVIATLSVVYADGLINGQHTGWPVDGVNCGGSSGFNVSVPQLKAAMGVVIAGPTPPARVITGKTSFVGSDVYVDFTITGSTEDVTAGKAVIAYHGSYQIVLNHSSSSYKLLTSSGRRYQQSDCDYHL